LRFLGVQKSTPKKEKTEASPIQYGSTINSTPIQKNVETSYPTGTSGSSSSKQKKRKRPNIFQQNPDSDSDKEKKNKKRKKSSPSNKSAPKEIVNVSQTPEAAKPTTAYVSPLLLQHVRNMKTANPQEPTG